MLYLPDPISPLTMIGTWLVAARHRAAQRTSIAASALSSTGLSRRACEITMQAAACHLSVARSAVCAGSAIALAREIEAEDLDAGGTGANEVNIDRCARCDAHTAAPRFRAREMKSAISAGALGPRQTRGVCR